MGQKRAWLDMADGLEEKEAGNEGTGLDGARRQGVRRDVMG